MTGDAVVRQTWIKRFLLVAVGAAIGFNGVVVAVAPDRIATTYGVQVAAGDVEVLLRHRAVMLALLGALVVASAIRQQLRSAVSSAAALSMASFVVLALGGDLNEQQRRVALLDVLLLALLGLALALPDRNPAPPGPARQVPTPPTSCTTL